MRHVIRQLLIQEGCYFSRRAARLTLMIIALIGGFMAANIMSKRLADDAYLVIFPSMVAIFLGLLWVCQRFLRWRVFGR